MDDSRLEGAGDAGQSAGAAASSGRDGAKADVAARVWRDLLELDTRLHDQRNIRLLTPEARVLIHLKINGPVSMTAAMQVAGVSARGFYAVLERLK